MRGHFLGDDDGTPVAASVEVEMTYEQARWRLESLDREVVEVVESNDRATNWHLLRLWEALRRVGGQRGGPAVKPETVGNRPRFDQPPPICPWCGGSGLVTTRDGDQVMCGNCRT